MESTKLPLVLAVLGRDDYGPSDGAGSTCCPHCGSAGRYVFRFLCDDGTRRGAMSGCFKLFRQTREAMLVAEAFGRSQDAKAARQKLATWWADMVKAAEELESGAVEAEAFRARVRAAESMRQAWLARKGYGRYGRRR